MPFVPSFVHFSIQLPEIWVQWLELKLQIWTLRTRATPKGCGELRGACVSEDFVEHRRHIKSELPTSTLSCVRETLLFKPVLFWIPVAL